MGIRQIYVDDGGDSHASQAGGSRRFLDRSRFLTHCGIAP